MFNLKKYLKKILFKKKIPCLHYLEVHLVDHCNLSCNACTHFSSISPEKFANINEFEKQMKALSKKLRFNRIRLLGGEPLLHPDIADFIEVTKKYFPKSFVSICTNGILLPSMKKDFWDTCRKNNVVIDISKYPVIEDKAALFENLIKENNVDFGGFHDGRDRKLFHNQWGNSDKYVSFENCAIHRKNIAILKDGRIFVCPKTAFIDIYNKYFAQSVPQGKGINIYFSSGKNIKKYLSKPVETCKYCSYMWKIVDWHISQKQSEEWNATNEEVELIKIQQQFLSMKSKNKKNP